MALVSMSVDNGLHPTCRSSDALTRNAMMSSMIPTSVAFGEALTHSKTLIA